MASLRGNVVTRLCDISIWGVVFYLLELIFNWFFTYDLIFFWNVDELIFFPPQLSTPQHFTFCPFGLWKQQPYFIYCFGYDSFQSFLLLMLLNTFDIPRSLNSTVILWNGLFSYLNFHLQMLAFLIQLGGLLPWNVAQKHISILCESLFLCAFPQSTLAENQILFLELYTDQCLFLASYTPIKLYTSI